MGKRKHDPENWNQKLLRARKRLCKTQAQVAEESLISANNYCNIEHNLHETSVKTALRIAKSLKSTVEELFG